MTEFKFHTPEREWHIGEDNNASVISCGQFFGLLLLQHTVFFCEDQECTSLPSRLACSERSLKSLGWLWGNSRKSWMRLQQSLPPKKLCQETSLGAPPFPGELISRAFPRVQHSSLGPLQFAPRPNGLPSSLTLNLPGHCGLTQWLLASVWTWQLSLTMTWYGNTLFKHWYQWEALMHAIQKLFALREVFWMYLDCCVSALVLAKDDFCSSQKKHGWDTEIVLYHPRSLLGLLGKVPTVWVDVAEGVVG